MEKAAAVLGSWELSVEEQVQKTAQSGWSLYSAWDLSRSTKTSTKT